MEAEELFGKEYVFYSTDYREIFKVYSAAGSYIGSRIHGAIPSIIHGASVNVLYSTDKAHVIENSTEILSQYFAGIEDCLKVIYIKNQDVSYPEEFVSKKPDCDSIRLAINKEKMIIQEKLKQTAVLSYYLQ